jgi:predicted molibdopterin-dependent oxidoreductase YjgC
MIEPQPLPFVRSVDLKIDGRDVRVPEGTTILDAAKTIGVETPTLCYLKTLTPVNACRVCVVEVEGSRVLVPACARKVEPGMNVKTDSDRVRLSRKLVFELLASSVDLSLATPEFKADMARYAAAPERFGDGHRATVAQPVKVDNDLYVRDYSKCVLCYKCVEACGVDAQQTFAIAVAGRGFAAGIATEFDTPLPDSACVYCGNCIGVCPTGALMFKSEYDMRAGRHLGRVAADGHRHDLSLLRRRLHPRAARAGQLHRQSHLTDGPRRDEWASVRQRTVWLAVCPEPIEPRT